MKVPSAKSPRLTLGFFLVITLIVLIPPLAGVALIVLQVLGDGSIDLSRYDLADIPRAALALGLVGVTLGYLHGLVPALVAAVGIIWLLVTQRQVTLWRVVLCVFFGGCVGVMLASPLIGPRQAMGVVVIMLAVTTALWFALRRAAGELFEHQP